MDEQKLNRVLADWNGGLTVEQIMSKYGLTHEQTWVLFIKTSKQQILKNWDKIKPGMKSSEIEQVIFE